MIPIDEFLDALRNSDEYIEYIYTRGSCYKFHLFLKKLWPEAIPYIHENKDHIVSRIGEYFYDITGRIETKFEVLYDELTEEDILNERVEKWSFYRNQLLKFSDCPNCDEPLTDLHIEIQKNSLIK